MKKLIMLLLLAPMLLSSCSCTNLKQDVSSPVSTEEFQDEQEKYDSSTNENAIDSSVEESDIPSQSLVSEITSVSENETYSVETTKEDSSVDQFIEEPLDTDSLRDENEGEEFSLP